MPKIPAKMAAAFRGRSDTAINDSYDAFALRGSRGSISRTSFSRAT